MSSFQATREEEHSTRGRANLLRAYITGGQAVSAQPLSEDGARAAFAALDLCLACKGCKAECPSAVDVAKLKYAFLEHYYRDHPRKLRDYIFANIGTFARLSSPLGSVVNALLRQPRVRRRAAGSGWRASVHYPRWPAGNCGAAWMLYAAAAVYPRTRFWLPAVFCIFRMLFRVISIQRQRWLR